MSIVSLFDNVDSKYNFFQDNKGVIYYDRPLGDCFLSLQEMEFGPIINPAFSIPKDARRVSIKSHDLLRRFECIPEEGVQTLHYGINEVGSFLDYYDQVRVINGILQGKVSSFTFNEVDSYLEKSPYGEIDSKTEAFLTMDLLHFEQIVGNRNIENKLRSLGFEWVYKEFI